MLNFNYADSSKILFSEAEDEKESKSSAENLTSAFLFVCQQPYLGKKSPVLRDTDLDILNILKDRELSSIDKYYEENKDIFDMTSSLRWEFLDDPSNKNRDIDYSKDYITIPEIKLADGRKYPIAANTKCGKLSSSLKMLKDSNKLETTIPEDKFLRLLNLLSSGLYRNKGIIEIISREASKPYTRDLFKIIATWASGLESGESVIGYNYYKSFLSDEQTSSFYHHKIPAKKILEDVGINPLTLTLQDVIDKSKDIESIIFKISEEPPPENKDSSEDANLFDNSGRLRKASNIDIATGSTPGKSIDYDPTTGNSKSLESPEDVLVTGSDTYWEINDDREDLVQNQLDSIQKISNSDYDSFLEKHKDSIRLNIEDLGKINSLKTNLDKEFQGKALHSLLVEFDELVDFNLALSGSYLDPISILLKIIPSIKLSKSVLIKAEYSDLPLEIKQSSDDLPFEGETSLMNTELGELGFETPEENSGFEPVKESIETKTIHLFITSTDMKENAISTYNVIMGDSPISYYDMITSKPYSIKNINIKELHAIESYELSNNFSGTSENFTIIRSSKKGSN